MKTLLKHLTMAGLAITALTWPSFRALAQVNEDLAARDELRRSELQDENGQISPDALAEAYAEKDAMPFLPEAWSEFVTAEQSQNGIKGGSWVSIGPGNIGGRMRSVIVRPPPDPSEPQNQRTVWAGGVAGGVWKSMNGGGSWFTSTDGLSNLAVNCMAIEPGYHAPGQEVLYAGTGEAYSGDGVRGNGIYKTANGGTTWIRLPSANYDPDFTHVNRIAISPNNSQLLLAAVLFKPSEQGEDAGKILRSTDGGTSWTTQLTINGDSMTDVRFKPTSEVQLPDEVPLINCLASSIDGRVYYSANGGATWSSSYGIPAPAPGARIELAYSRSNPLIVYASRAPGGGYPDNLFRSDNGGYSFRSLGNPHAPTGPDPNAPDRLPGSSPYTNVLWVDPTDPDTVVVGGVYSLRTRDAGADDGPHWQEASNVGFHQDHHMMAEDSLYDGVDNRTVYDVNDGGIYKTANILASCQQPACVEWTRLNNKLYVTQFYGAAGNGPTGTIFGATQDNGTVRFKPENGGTPQDWDTLCVLEPSLGWICGGDTTKCATDQTSQPYLYWAHGDLKICRKANDNLPAAWIWGGDGHPNGIPAPQRCDFHPCADGLAPFVIDPNPNQQARMVAGGESLWRTTNATDGNPLNVCWLEIKGPTGFGNIRALAVAEGDSDIIWVGYKGQFGRVFYTTNGTLGACPTPSSTPTWFSGDPSLVLPQNRPCTHIAIARPNQSDPPEVARKIYVTFGTYPRMEETAGNVWKRENDGVTWTDLSYNRLPRVPVYTLVISPSNPDFLYVGTEVGIFASANDGASWSPAFGGTASDFVFSLVSSAAALDPDIIYVGTNAGVFSTADGGGTWAPGFGGPANTPVVELFWMINGTNKQLVGATHGRGMFSLTTAN